MFEVTYVLQDVFGKESLFIRKFYDKDIAESEQNFAVGTKLTSGKVIKKVSFRKVK